jgi:hypothetical protein
MNAKPTDLSTTIESAWKRLATPSVPAEAPAPFDPDSVAALPPPAARWLRRVLPPGTPLVETVTVAMHGQIKLGPRWMPFTADQIIRAGCGFVWRPIVGGRLIRFVGADMLDPDHARMEFRLHGLIPVVRATGPDTARSAAGRLAAETVAWLPQAATPQAGARWTPIDGCHAAVALDTPTGSVDVRVGVGDDGRLRSVLLDRWNDSADPPSRQPFGGDVTGELETSTGVMVAGSGTVGWGFETPEWDDGEFFRYRISEVDEQPSPTR